MKYVILHGAGMADAPHQGLGGQTPLQVAATPNMDHLARHGELGTVGLPPEVLSLGSEAVPLALLGYDPRTYSPTSAMFDAASLGVVLEKTDVAFRCSLVTLRVSGRGGATADLKKLGSQVYMEDDAAGGIDTDDAKELIAALNDQLGSEAILFYPGSGHRHLMVWAGGKSRITCFGPHHVVGHPVSEFLPTGEGSEILRQVMEASVVILRYHPVNERRQETGLKPANCLWVWGPGRAAPLPSLTARYRISGTVLSTADALRGIGICAGLDAQGAERFAGTNGTAGKAQAESALQALRQKDMSYVHVQVPTEAARDSEPKAKIKAVEEFDRDVVGTILQGLSALGPHRVLLVCDDAPRTDRSAELAAGLPVLPYVLYDSAVRADSSTARGFSEAEARASQAEPREATKLLAQLISHG